MKLTKILFLAIICIAFSAHTAAAVGPEHILKEAADLVLKAEKASNPAERNALLQNAIKNYDRVLKQYPRTIEAAEALLAKAEAVERMGITEKQKNKNHHAALQLYKQIKTQYGLREDKLVERYGSDAEEVKRIVARAQALHDALFAEIDRRNSKNPLYQLIDSLVALTGRKQGLSYWLAIIIITLGVKILITPLTKAQFKSMREMQRIQPLVKQLQEKYKGNQRELGEKVMALYKEHGINPLAGCLPLLIQFPILYFLYYTIRLYEFQFTKGTFLWISPVLGERFPGWIGSNLAQPDIPLVILYTISMIISMRLSNVDPTQAQQQKLMSIYMPILFAFLFRTFPAAFMLYWLVFNILTTVQQYYIIHGQQEPVTAAAETETAIEQSQGGATTTPPASPADSRQAPRTTSKSRSRRRRK